MYQNSDRLTVLTTLAGANCSIKSAAGAIGADPSVVFRWARDQNCIVTGFPEEGDSATFGSCLALARKMSVVLFESHVRETALRGQARILTCPSGVVWKENETIVRNGDQNLSPAELHEWYGVWDIYERDEHGCRIPVTVYDAIPSATVCRLLGSLLPSTYSESKRVDVTISPSVLVVGSKPVLEAIAAPVIEIEPEAVDHAQPETEPDQGADPGADIMEDRPGDSDLVRDLRRRLRQPPANPTPHGPVPPIGGRESDPPDDIEAPPHAARAPAPRVGVHDPNPNEGYKVA